ncbi:ribose 5-phosphate isomerase B [Vibrio hangzhouensis]|uniref:ribose 5-phosphate isomerase B n=1 Tax=Vibrio hangzhouensis TaxID=462991 RepID=UPI001C975638|nr:ribose 5-phosphate isomerase B [Vibrio hangzhouensis]MBY6198581.1 ribose 5-phosphate isomerase B [Vibrio hangzhouensis]
MIISIGCDHVGFEHKAIVINHLEQKGHQVIDLGAQSAERTDYPQYGKSVADSVISGQADRGILICGTGVGISLAANKVPGIRAVVCSDPYTAQLSREHNDTNILSFGSRVVGIELAKMIVDRWLEGEFEGGRHQNRINQIADIEQEVAHG